jgi:hypothetical protein
MRCVTDVKMDVNDAGGDQQEKKDGGGEEEETSTSGQETDSTGSEEGTSSKKQDAGTAVDKPAAAVKHIFRLAYVNSYGSSDSMPEMQNNGKPLKLNSESRGARGGGE